MWRNTAKEMVTAQSKLGLIEIESIETKSVTMTVKGLLEIWRPPKCG
jgi:hypothetical protein